MINKYLLIIFDVDVTLTKPETDRLLPTAEAYFKQLASVYPDRNGPQIALATNQDGVGLRHWMEVERFGEPEIYPTQFDVERRIYSVAKQIRNLYADPDIYISFAYQSKEGTWSPTPCDDRRCDPRWRRDWRKPLPGMLLDAMCKAEVYPEETLVVSDDGPETAQNAGCDFMWAHEFFLLGLSTPNDRAYQEA